MKRGCSPPFVEVHKCPHFVAPRWSSGERNSSPPFVGVQYCPHLGAPCWTYRKGKSSSHFVGVLARILLLVGVLGGNSQAHLLLEFTTAHILGLPGVNSCQDGKLLASVVPFVHS